ncbi:PdaC/SigV domain-containing protein [Virgibacillus salinus]|uniref:PdaC/SigV domain-containing protein n=1 Tax=Virgibacillus salinus TaxID=553311 RepID=UPI0026C43F73
MPQSLPVNIEPMRVSYGTDIQLIYPHVFGMRDQGIERFINQNIVDETQQLINIQVTEMPTTLVEMDGSFETKNNQRDVLSLSLYNYAYHYQAAHGMTYIKSLTFDLENKSRCSLSDLFKQGSNYVDRISELINEQIQERDIGTFEVRLKFSRIRTFTLLIKH